MWLCLFWWPDILFIIFVIVVIVFLFIIIICSSRASLVLSNKGPAANEKNLPPMKQNALPKGRKVHAEEVKEEVRTLSLLVKVADNYCDEPHIPQHVIMPNVTAELLAFVERWMSIPSREANQPPGRCKPKTGANFWRQEFAPLGENGCLQSSIPFIVRKTPGSHKSRYLPLKGAQTSPSLRSHQPRTNSQPLVQHARTPQAESRRLICTFNTAEWAVMFGQDNLNPTVDPTVRNANSDWSMLGIVPFWRWHCINVRISLRWCRQNL